jgi:hypothetical protein
MSVCDCPLCVPTCPECTERLVEVEAPGEFYYECLNSMCERMRVQASELRYEK